MKKVMKAVVALMLMTAVVFAAGCNKPDEPNNGGNNNGGNNSDGNINGYAYVDLGLPSGNLWATCNVGATTPEGYGNYFAWGETETKNHFDWENYKFGDYMALIKYCDDGYYGASNFFDNLTELQSVDDAATINWGDGWRMPNKADWEELIEKTTRSYEHQNNVYGCLFKASNGKSLFMPAAGKFWYNSQGDMSGESGYYWSSSLGTKKPYRAWAFLFGVGCDMSEDISRSIGYTVRPVHSAN